LQDALHGHNNACNHLRHDALAAREHLHSTICSEVLGEMAVALGMLFG
jgi:hypothetical protein